VIDNSHNHQEKLYGKNPKKFVTEQIDSLKIKIWFKQDKTTLLGYFIWDYWCIVAH